MPRELQQGVIFLINAGISKPMRVKLDPLHTEKLHP